MSSLQRAVGFVGGLFHPFEKEYDIEKWLDRFDNDKSCLSINYDGTLIYYDFNKYNEDEDESIFYVEIGKCYNKNLFIKELIKYNLVIKPNSIQSFSCIWYNGSDCPIDTLTYQDIWKGYKIKE